MPTLPGKPEIEIITRPAGASVERAESLTVIELSPKEILHLQQYLARLAKIAICSRPCQRGIAPLSGDEDEDGKCFCFASI
jgi:hypothetical protein